MFVCLFYPFLTHFLSLPISFFHSVPLSVYYVCHLFFSFTREACVKVCKRLLFLAMFQSKQHIFFSALPAVHLELATRNYLGGPLDWRAIQFEVENAERKPSTPLGLSRLSLNSQIDVFHGMAVDDFVVTECRNLGLWSGLRPENAKVSKPTNKCFVM